MAETYPDIFFLLTKLLNRGLIENLFWILRGKDGNNRYASMYDFNVILAKIMSCNLIEYSKHTNYMVIQDGTIFVVFSVLEDAKISTTPRS